MSEKSDSYIPYNKVLEQRENTALEIFEEFFSTVKLNVFQMDQVDQEVVDMNVWRDSVKFWAANGYQGRAIGKLLDLYKRTLEKKASEGKTSRVVHDDFAKCPVCENGFTDTCPIHGGKK